MRRQIYSPCTDSRPAIVGLALGERLRLPWFRTVFTNIGDVLSPETLPPLELESRPVDVGELITDQLSHFWWGSLLRNLADRGARNQKLLNLTAKPILDMIPEILDSAADVVGSRRYAESVSTGQPKSTDAPRPVNLQPAMLPVEKLETLVKEPTAADPMCDIRRSRIRQRIWDRAGRRTGSIHGLGAFEQAVSRILLEVLVFFNLLRRERPALHNLLTQADPAFSDHHGVSGAAGIILH